ncbi:MAG: ABC transporter ATP-binding protein [Streptosporangiaceae bacterium]
MTVMFTDRKPHEPEISGARGGPGEVRLEFCGTGLTFPDGTEAVRSVDLEIQRGEFVSLIGPSGCGKSTLLRIASGLLEPTGGELRCDQKDIGYVFQDPTLLPWRTVQGNVELFAELHGIPRRERAARAAEVLKLVGLTGSESKYPKALSGGMRSRVSMARSLLLHPSLFLFDEPFAAIDEITRERLNDQLIQLFTMERFAGVFVTHSISEACFLASRVVVMTKRPATVHAVVQVPFDYPRTAELRYDAEFVDITKRVSTLLRESQQSQQSQEGAA